MTDRIGIKDIADELRRGGGHPPLCYWVNLMGAQWGWRKTTASSSWWLPRAEADLKIALWLADDINTTDGRLRLETAHRERVQSGNRRVYVRQAQIALGDFGQSIEVQVKADEFESRQLRHDIAKLKERIVRGVRGMPMGLYQRAMRPRDRRTLASLEQRLEELRPLHEPPVAADLIVVADGPSARVKPVAEVDPPPAPLDWRPKGREGWYYEVNHHAGFQRIVVVKKPNDWRLKFFGQTHEFIPDPIPLGPVSIAKGRLYGKRSRWQAKITSDEGARLGI